MELLKFEKKTTIKVNHLKLLKLGKYGYFQIGKVQNETILNFKRYKLKYL